MKLKFILTSLVGLFAASMIASAQSTPAAADNTQTPATPAIAANTTAPADPTPSPAPTAQATQQDAGAVTNAATNAVTTATDTNTAVTTQATASTNAAPRDPNAVIPLIVMDEVPLTDAIKNLARQAGLNYMLDPKLPFLAVNEAGVRAPQPTVSLRWENITADQALYAVLNNYNLNVVDDPKTKIARITVKDPAAPDPLVTKTIQLKYSDPTNVVASIQTILQDKRSKVVPDVRTSQLVVVATEKEIVAVDELVVRLDTPIRQVLIETKLVETSKNPVTSKGMDWTGTLQHQQIRFGNNPLTQTPATPGNPGVPPSVTTVGTTTFTNSGTPATPATPEVLSRVLSPSQPMLTANTQNGFFPHTFFLNADGVSTVLSFLNTEADARILSTPRAVTLDNQEATLSVTTAQPIFKTTAGTQGSPGGAEITYTNLGTILRVTPRISANNTINLKVIPEVSDLAGTVTKTVAGLVNQADAFDIRHIETRVVIPSGNTLVMGGLLNDNQSKGTTKVPLFGDVPGLGWLFRSETKAQNKRNLIVFITPTIVEDEDFQPTRTDFLKTKADEKSPVTIGPWDQGDPQDWSKLFGKQPAEGSEKAPEPTSK